MKDEIDIEELRAGLWRWAVPHPDWTPDKAKPGGWDRIVGCAFARTVDGVVLIDPLAPPPGPAADRFFRELDRDVAEDARPVAIVIGNPYHVRSAASLRERFASSPGATVFAHEATRAKLGGAPLSAFSEDRSLGGGTRAFVLDGLEAGEVAYYLPEHRALAFADAVIGAGGGELRVCPASWGDKSAEGQARYRDAFRPSLARLLELPIDVVLVGHGEPARQNGRAALAAALARPAWGE